MEAVQWRDSLAYSRGLDTARTHPARGLRVVVDARKLTHGGIGVYTQNLIRSLINLGGIELTLLVGPGFTGEGLDGGAFNTITDSAPLYSLDELLRLPRRLAQHRFDLYHVPHFTLPFGLGCPGIVTVHDLIHVTHPERMFYPLVAGPLIRSALRRAAHVVTVSEATRREILSFAGNGLAEKLSVIPNVSITALNDGIGSGSLNKFRLEDPFILAVFSNVKPHKGALDLLTAFDSIQHLPGQKPALALVGQGTEHFLEQPALFAKLKSLDNVHILGPVSTEDLLALYGGARALVVPSLAEGFCLPVLEAKSLGVPVVARPVPAVMELLGEADIVASDMSAPAFGRALREATNRIASGVKWRGGLSAEQISRFDPNLVGLQIAEIYAATCGRIGGHGGR